MPSKDLKIQGNTNVASLEFRRPTAWPFVIIQDILLVSQDALQKEPNICYLPM